jgi:hypothetical protein
MLASIDADGQSGAITLLISASVEAMLLSFVFDKDDDA